MARCLIGYRLPDIHDRLLLVETGFSLGLNHHLIADRSRPLLSTVCCTTTLSCAMILRKGSLVLAQSTTSTRMGRSEVSKASLMLASLSSDKGAGVIRARSRSEYGLAQCLAREPKAHTSSVGLAEGLVPIGRRHC